MAIGLLVSALTESQAVAFFVTFIVFLMLWFVLGPVGGRVSGWAGSVMLYVSFQERLDGFVRGLIDTRDVVYFLTVTILALIVAFRALERRKWA